MNGRRGDASVDRWRERFERERMDAEVKTERLTRRAELRSAGEEEISEVIHQEALERQRKKESEPPPSKATPLVVVLTVARKFPPWGAVVVALAAIAAWVFLKSR